MVHLTIPLVDMVSFLLFLTVNIHLCVLQTAFNMVSFLLFLTVNIHLCVLQTAFKSAVECLSPLSPVCSGQE